MLSRSRKHWRIGYVCSISQGRQHITCGIRRWLCTDVPTTPTMKDLSHPLASKYQPGEVESGWYQWWEQEGFFRRTGAQEKFVMVLPPPNVTGTLHLGHALTCSVQDAIARWHQMQGAEVVFVPGCDHAGIATQVVVEQHLWNTQATTRHQLGRERFVDEVWKWKKEKGNTIYEQMKRLGTTLDWHRAVFTMDQHMSDAVKEAFIQLFDCGLVYRKKAPVNWCCSLQSTISDIEVEHTHLTGPSELMVPGYKEPVTFGKMYDFAYKVVGLDEELIVSTTRPETVLGDTAIMVHPDDPRYSRFIGMSVFHPFRQEPIPIIEDEAVDPDFGTGVVKVTPGHSQEDFEVGLRHNLPQITIFDEQGHLNDVVKEFKGLPRFAARPVITEALKNLGLYRGCHPHPMMLPLCTRTHDVIEHMLKPQWFIRCSDMATEAIKAVRTGELQIHPDMHRRTWQEWLESGREWCVSRQLWWGHRVPAYCVTWRDGHQLWLAAHSEDDARHRAMEREGLPASSIISVTQDDDVLDTWFSSGLYPFVVFGWPQDTLELRAHYPITLLETGHDILFFWVARMVMLALKLTGELPFKTVLLHGLICDADGHKMSKSRGNIVDPLHVINGAALEELKIHSGSGQELLKTGGSQMLAAIPECGADALRFTLCSTNFKNQLLSVDITRAEQNRFLCNKIWQTVRFLVSALKRTQDKSRVTSLVLPSRGVCYSLDELALMDRWILSRLSVLVHSASRHFEAYDLHLVTAAFTDFWYYNLCDVYLESIKPTLKHGTDDARTAILQTLWTAVDVGLLVLSPFMPYLTEELYHRLPRAEPSTKSIMQCSYPQPSEWSVWKDGKAEELVTNLQHVAAALRSLTAQYSIPSSKAQGSIVTTDTELAAALSENMVVMKTLGHVGSLQVVVGPDSPPPASAVVVISHTTSVYLHLQNIVNIAAEIARLHKKARKLEKELTKLTNRMTAHKYQEHTPDHKQEAHSEKVSSLKRELAHINNLITHLEKT